MTPDVSLPGPVHNLSPGIKELLELARDRRLDTVELHPSNDFYGHATILKKYLGLPEGYQIKAAIEHGPFFGRFIWDADLNASVPAIFVPASFRYPVLRSRTQKALFSIGPILSYASHYMDQSSLVLEKQRLGKNLLVFPAHSTHWVDIEFDIKSYCDTIETLGREFNSVRVCLYWRDILRGLTSHYHDRGFECVTAGHMFDSLFLPRLRSIIETSTITTSNQIGTHIGYCASLNKPHWLMSSTVSKTSTKNDMLAQCDHMLQNPEEILEIRDAFTGLDGSVSASQMEVVDKYWGLSQVKPPKELATIIDMAEDMYKRSLDHHHSAPLDTPFAFKQSIHYLNNAGNLKAVTLLRFAHDTFPENPRILYGKAIALARLGQTADAKEDLRSLVRQEPDFSKARFLLAELENLPNANYLQGSILGTLSLPTINQPLVRRARTKSTVPPFDENTPCAAISQHMGSFRCVEELTAEASPNVELGRPVIQVQTGKQDSIFYMIDQAGQLLQRGEINQAFDLSAKAKRLKTPTRGLDYIRALCFLKMDQSQAALQALNEELRHFPHNIEAKNLLVQITAHNSVEEVLPKDSEFRALYAIIRPYTMLSSERLYSLFNRAKVLCQQNRPGNFVECGVAAGGSTALLAYVIKRYSTSPRKLYAFDCFEGMPDPSDKDSHNGTPANATGWGTGTCSAPEESVRQICTRLHVWDVVTTVKGYFQATLPRMRDKVGMVALLHLDGDWYDSTLAILDNLYDRVLAGGILQVDDYGYWEGCRKAIHEFMGKRSSPLNLNKIDGTGVWFSKTEQFETNPSLADSLVREFVIIESAQQNIESQMSPNERFQLFYALHRLLPRRANIVRFVEIGSYAGSSLHLAYATLKRLGISFHGFSIEPNCHPRLPQILKIMEGHISHLNAKSGEAIHKIKQVINSDGILPEFILVDGDHSYEGVRNDISLYYPLLAPGGIMVFHDFLPPLNNQNREAIMVHHCGREPGIRRACRELMEEAYGCRSLDLPLLYPSDPTQTQAHLPIIPGVYSTIRAYRKPTRSGSKQNQGILAKSSRHPKAGRLLEEIVPAGNASSSTFEKVHTDSCQSPNESGGNIAQPWFSEVAHSTLPTKNRIPPVDRLGSEHDVSSEI